MKKFVNVSLILGITVTLLLLLGLSPATAVPGAPVQSVASGEAPHAPDNPITCSTSNNDIGGVVFLDFDADGEKDANESGSGLTDIVVKAYDSSGAEVGSVNVDAHGNYVFSGLAANAPVRLEFTNLPAYLYDGTWGSDSQTRVQFVDAATCDADLAVTDVESYCQEEPDLVTPIILQGGGTDNSLVSFPYTADGTNPNLQTGLVSFDKIGSTWGLAHQKSSNSIFISAYMKRHTPFGPGGTGMLYRYDTDDGTLEQFLDLNSLFPGSTGTDPHPAGTDYDHDPNSWDSVGKISLGDIDISADELTLWAINLNDRLLYEIPLHDVLQPTAPTSASEIHRWPEDTTNGMNLTDLTGLDCPDPDTNIRPFGLKEYHGMVYVGLVCSAESTQNLGDLRAYVYGFDPGAHTFTQVLTFPLNYPRGAAYLYSNGDTVDAEWQYWRTDGNLTHPENTEDVAWPQPILSDIEFYHGDMILGFRDRLGDQTGYKQYLPGGDEQLSGVTAGDILRASPSGSGWAIENNAQGSTFGPSNGANTGQGPGNGEFYFSEKFEDPPYAQHDETSMGALVQVASLDEIVMASMDPRDGSGIWAYYKGGVKWMNHTTGDVSQINGNAHQYEMTDEFGKAHGLGDLEALCDPPPIEIGNRLWVDRDGDGIQDPGEEPLEGVTVVLKDPGGNVIGTAVTDANGEYFFSSDPNRSDTGNADYGISELLPNTSGYTIEVDLTQSALDGLALTDNDADSSANGDTRDSDAIEENNTAVITVDTGSVGENNHTYDIGFRPKVAVGNFVWHDANNNAQVDSGEEGIPTIPVKLYRDTNGDGVLDPAVDELVDSTTTDSNGYYQFLNVPPSTAGDPTTYYFVAVDQQAVKDAGYDYSSTGGDHDPDATGDHDAPQGDDGVPNGTYVVSQPFPATVGGQSQASQSDTGDPENYYDDSAYMTVDFGFFNDDDNAPTAIIVQDVTAKTNSIVWALAFLMVAMFGLSFFWLWRQHQSK